MPALTGVHHARSIDEILGDRSTRFFAEGFKKITRSVSGLVVYGDGCDATASLGYPADWSRKGAADLRPHLSTIDALVLAVATAEAHLAQAAGLDAGRRSRAWLRSFTMKAGRNPHEDLSAFPIRLRVRPAASDAGTATTYQCQVGAIRVVLEVEHEPGTHPATSTERRFADLADAVGGGPRGYLDRMVEVTHQLHEVTVTPGDVSAVVDIAAARGGRIAGDAEDDAPPTGFAAAYEPSLSPVDCLVCMAQLAQSVMYSLDRIERRESDTLWMRTVTFETDRPRHPMRQPFIARLEITRSRLLWHDGAPWRTADVAGDFHGLRVGSSLAHRLPQSQSQQSQSQPDQQSVSAPTSIAATAGAV